MAMTAVRLLSLSLTVGLQSANALPQPDPQLIRVHVRTDDGGVPEELAARRDSVKHLATAIASQKKGKVMIIVDSDDRADVVVDVVDRGVRIPKVVIGLGGMGSQPGRPAPLPAPTRVVQLRVTTRLANGGDPVELTNKNRAVSSASGWKSAAEDLAKQVEKWVADSRATILAARRDAYPHVE